MQDTRQETRHKIQVSRCKIKEERYKTRHKTQVSRHKIKANENMDNLENKQVAPARKPEKNEAAMGGPCGEIAYFFLDFFGTFCIKAKSGSEKGVCLCLGLGVRKKAKIESK